MVGGAVERIVLVRKKPEKNKNGHSFVAQALESHSLTPSHESPREEGYRSS